MSLVMSVCSMALLTSSQTAAQRPTLEAGDRWSADRTIHFVSTAAEIDMQFDDHFEYVIKSANHRISLQVKRHTTATHLSNGVVIPAPKGEPEQWTLDIMPTGEMVMVEKPMDKLEQILSRIVLAAWNGPSAKQKQPLIEVSAISDLEEHIDYDEAPIRGQGHISGTATLDPKTRIPISISLLGERIPMPGGSDIVSFRVEYRAKREKPKTADRLSPAPFLFRLDVCARLRRKGQGMEVPRKPSPTNATMA